MFHKAEVEFGEGKIISIETGVIAKQADGAILARCGGTAVLSTVVGDHEARQDADFFPLTVDYREKAYAAGKIPGGYFKREGRPTDKETLTARLIDRPIRPLFAEGYLCSTHVVNLVLSHDQKNEPDLLAVLGSSAALMISDLPFLGPVSPVRIGRIDGELIANPTCKELEQSEMNLTVVASETAIVMVEGGSKGLPESVFIEALKFAFEKAQILNRMQRELQAAAGKAKREIVIPTIEWIAADGSPVDPTPVFSQAEPRLLEALLHPDKKTVADNISAVKKELAAVFDLTDPARKAAFGKTFKETEKRVARGLILSRRQRNDGRATDEIRPIHCEVDLLAAPHGSALFTRGQTQTLATLTLGTTLDEQKIDDLEGEIYKSFMLHYNFPPFCVGETGFLRGPGRREIGHGALAERAIQPMLPPVDQFPYTIRIVSDVMESNGSSSMASVCGATLSLMDGGVPLLHPVAGIAMGLITEGDDSVVLSDISGLEDHLGDMDFKVAGSRDGITAIQMDIKLTGFRFEILEHALEQARRGRVHILDTMAETIREPRPELKPHAPRIYILKIPTEKIATLIGPGGKMIRALTAETGASIEIEDDGTVKIFSADLMILEAAVQRIKSITEEAEIGKDYMGTVRRIENYGAFIEILPGTDGLLHVSRMANYRVDTVTDEMQIGDKVLVRVVEIDPAGKVKLGRDELMREGQVEGKKEPSNDTRPPRSSSDRPRYRDGGRDGGRDG
ncbi:polyribonucleotide nucleotidyltransferase, partial [bacterium]|nr:polyribonucleotide nucleotidyltransferase [candidate division CSSED10-310 bacterium]